MTEPPQGAGRPQQADEPAGQPRAGESAPEGSADRVAHRQTILARRAQFVAAALASAGLAASLEGCSPCLSMAPPAQSPESTAESPDGGAGEDVMPEPEPCLHPEPCLEPEPPPEDRLQPEVCLSDMPLDEMDDASRGDPVKRRPES